MSIQDKKNENVDSLTGLKHYDSFVIDLEDCIENANDTCQEISLVLLDIDNLKRINDNYGHDIGDVVLISLANQLVSSLNDKYMIYRYSGDQFAVIMKNTEKEVAFLDMEKLREGFTIDELKRHDSKEFQISATISIGISNYPGDGNRVAELVRKADGALYRAKISGRNKVCLSREEKMITKTSHYTYEQLQRLGELAKKEGIGEAVLLREALDDLLKKYDL